MDILLQLLQPISILVMSIGVLLGIIIGALPGLTPTMGVAMAIPFTFSLPPEYGLLLLGGIYSGAVYGGSIPAILFNIPGAPASVATTFEGYPMAKKGEAKKALELSTIASTIGGLIGMFLLLFFAPVFADISLQFGPAENFWIAIFGITIIAVITDGSMIKNMIGGSIGILLSMIGIHTITGTARFTFGSESLIGGLHVVSVLIGLFAFPQALHLIKELRKEKEKHIEIFDFHDSNKTTLRSSFKDIIKNPKALSIGTIIGLIVGVAPGAGGNVASIMAYNELKRFSKDKKKFGTGLKEGIIASESANNAEVGGALVPLLTLGIPGSPTSAIFLGGLMIHGIWPGRDLFVGHAEVANLFLYGMIFIQVLILFLGLFAIRYFSKLVNIPNYFMAPMIISFSIIGAYTTQNNTFDIYSMVIMGIMMYLFQKFGFTAAPVALGFILGPIAEEGLLQGISIGASNGSILSFFFSGKWNLILIAIIVITMTYSIWFSFKQRKRTEYRPPHSFSLRNRFTLYAIPWMSLLVLSILSALFVQTMDFEMRIFPFITLLFLIFFSVVQIFKSLFQKAGTHERPPFKSLFTNVPFISFIVVVSLLTDFIGFYAQVLILMISVPIYYYMEQRNLMKPTRILLVSTTFTILLYFVFTSLIKVPLPTGFTLNLLQIFTR